MASVAAQDPGAGWTSYRDAAGRFSFSYPVAFGATSVGTDSGFGGRTASTRFSMLSGLGGEAVLTSGPVTVDVQALGGLYDIFARSALPDTELATLLKALPAVTASNFCALLGSTDRLQGLTLAPRLLAAARELDAVRNVQPVVHQCVAADGVIAFHKEATFVAGAMQGRQHIFGAIRFLTPPYSSFQIVRALPTAPSASDVEVLRQLVRSFTTG